MSDWERPPLPTEGEKSRLIAAAVEAALPPRASAPARLSRTLHALGLPMLFFGMADCLFLAVAATLACLAPVGYVAAHEGQLAPLLFLFSPFLYAALTLLSLWKERMDGTWEWRRSCRLPFRAVAALRMLVFGAASAAASVAANLWLWGVQGQEAPLAGMLGVSFSSLFFYAALSLACQRARRLGALFAAPAAWCALGAALAAWEGADAVVLNAPIAVFVLVVGASFALCLWEFGRFAAWPGEGGLRYAFR